jgi:mannosyltransferase
LTQPRYQSFQAALAKKIDDAGLSERIIFLGEIPANEVYRWYQRCLICVACPRYEPFGLTPFEAAASGCALVCSKTGAFDALVEEGANGHLLPENDSNHLAAALAQLLTDTHGTARMGIEARERVTCHFSIEREAEAIDAVYERLFRAAALG